MSLISTSQIQELISTISQCQTEKDIEEKIIKPFLLLLGYTDNDYSQQALIGDKRVDFLIKNKRLSPHRRYLLVEVKSAQQSLPQFSLQVKEYLQNSGTLFGLLTNGQKFVVFYNNHGNINVIEQFSLKNIQEDQQSVSALTYLSKASCEQVISLFAKKDERIYSKVSNALAHKFDLQIPSYNNGNGEKRKSMIITVFNNKGGVGKTTMTINLAAALNCMGKKVMLIDIDPQANLTTGLGIDPLGDVEEKGKKDICNLLLEPKTKVDDVLYSKKWNQVALDIIPSHIRLSDMEPQLLSTVDVDNVLVKKLKKYKEEYDFILIDPPPSFGKVNTISLMASSGLLIPTQLAPYPIRALEYVINRAFAIDDAREQPLLILGIAVSMYDNKASKVKKEMFELMNSILVNDERRKEIEILPEKTWIPNLAAVSTNTLRGYPLCEAQSDDDLKKYDKESIARAFSHYQELANSLEKKVSLMEGK